MVKESNPGFAGGIAKRSKARQLSYALKGAPVRKKDLRLNAVAGIAEARKLRDRVTTLMLKADANPEDAIVLCVFAKPDLSAPIKDLAQLGVTNGPSDFALIKAHVDELPIGFLIFVVDRLDSHQPIYGHSRPLIVEDPRGLELNAWALRAYEQRIKDRLGLDERN